MTADQVLEGLSTESKFLLRCARRTVGGTDSGITTDGLAEELDWHGVLERAQRQRLVPVLNASFAELDGDLVPSSVEDDVRSEARGIASHNLHRTTELVELLQLFEDHGLRAMPFKGPTLAERAYGGISGRQFSDLDIIIHGGYADTIRSLLRGRGYTPDLETGAVPDWLLTRYHKGVHMYREADRISVDLHWRPWPPKYPRPLSVSDLFARAESTSIQNYAVPTLSVEDLLLVLAVHGGKHRWHLLKWLCDWAAVVTVTAPDWDAVIERARQSRMERNLLLAAALAHQVLEVDLPRTVVESLENRPGVDQLASEAVTSMFAGPEEISDTSIGFRIRSLDTRRDRIRYLTRVLTHPSAVDFEFLPLPARLHPLYRVVRPVRIVNQYGTDLGGYVRDLRRPMTD